MFKTVEELIVKVDMTPYVKERLQGRLLLIESKGIGEMEQLRQLMNFICPNVKKLLKTPRLCDYGTYGYALQRFQDAWFNYTYENSQAEFPYTIENLEQLKKYIKEIA